MKHLVGKVITKKLGDYSTLKVYNGIEVELIKSKEHKLEIAGEKSEIVKVKNVNNTLKLSLPFSLKPENRYIDGKSFLDEKFSVYEKLLQSSNDATDYTFFQIDNLTPPLMKQTREQNEEETIQDEPHHILPFKIPSLESVATPHWHKIMKDRQQRTRLRKNSNHFLYDDKHYSHNLGTVDEEKVDDDSVLTTDSCEEYNEDIQVVIKDANESPKNEFKELSKKHSPRSHTIFKK